jgi:hypothetical protein
MFEPVINKADERLKGLQLHKYENANRTRIKTYANQGINESSCAPWQGVSHPGILLVPFSLVA